MYLNNIIIGIKLLLLLTRRVFILNCEYLSKQQKREL